MALPMLFIFISNSLYEIKNIKSLIVQFESLSLSLLWLILCLLNGQTEWIKIKNQLLCQTRDDHYRSQMYGLLIALLWLVTFVCIILLVNWRQVRNGWAQDQFFTIYKSVEEQELRNFFEEKARLVARENIQNFFTQKRTKTEWSRIGADYDKVDSDLTSLCRLAESEIKKSKIDREETIFKMIESVNIPEDIPELESKNETFDEKDEILEAMPQKPPRTPTVAHHNLNKTQ